MCKTALGKAKLLVKKSSHETFFALMVQKVLEIFVLVCQFTSSDLAQANSHGLWVPKPCCRCCELRHPLKVLVAFCSPYSTAVMAFLFPAPLQGLGSIETLELYLHSEGKQSQTEFHLNGSLGCNGFPKLQGCRGAAARCILGRLPPSLCLPTDVI